MRILSTAVLMLCACSVTPRSGAVFEEYLGQRHPPAAAPAKRSYATYHELILDGYEPIGSIYVGGKDSRAYKAAEAAAARYGAEVVLIQGERGVQTVTIYRTGFLEDRSEIFLGYDYLKVEMYRRAEQPDYRALIRVAALYIFDPCMLYRFVRASGGADQPDWSETVHDILFDLLHIGDVCADPMRREGGQRHPWDFGSSPEALIDLVKVFMAAGFDPRKELHGRKCYRTGPCEWPGEQNFKHGPCIFLMEFSDAAPQGGEDLLAIHNARRQRVYAALRKLLASTALSASERELVGSQYDSDTKCRVREDVYRMQDWAKDFKPTTLEELEAEIRKMLSAKEKKK